MNNEATNNNVTMKQSRICISTTEYDATKDTFYALISETIRSANLPYPSADVILKDGTFHLLKNGQPTIVSQNIRCKCRIGYKGVYYFSVMEDDNEISCQLIRRTGIAFQTFDFEKKCWKQSLIQNFSKIDNFSMDDIYSAFVKVNGNEEQKDLTEEDEVPRSFRNLLSKYEWLRMLYKLTFTVMKPYCQLEEDSTVLYLCPRDVHGFMVGQDGADFVLYQQTCAEKVLDVSGAYMREVGRTNQIDEITDVLARLTRKPNNVWEYFSLPLSLHTYTKSDDPEMLGKDILCERELDAAERQNLTVGKRNMKNLALLWRVYYD